MRTMGEPQDSDVIDLVAIERPDGSVVYESIESAEPHAPQDLLLSDGDLKVTKDGVSQTSQLPRERLAGDSWEQMLDVMRDVEEGRGGRDLVLAPGGQMEIRSKDDKVETLSRLPQERLA